MTSDPLTQEIEVLQALIGIRGRQAELQTCCERAEANKNEVSGTVFARVMSDYRDRLTALDSEAMPLKLQARDAHTALRASYSDVHRTHEQAASEREELLFRHKVGEFDQAVLDTRLQQPDRQLAECAEALAALDERRARFLEAFGGEDNLEAFMAQAPRPVAPAPEPAPAPLPAPVPQEPPLAEAPSADAAPAITRSLPIPDVVPEPATRAVQPPPDDAVPEADRTRMVTLDAAGNLVVPEPAPAPAGVSDTGEARTMILPSAALTVRLKGEPPREYAVSPVTSIGRSDHNTVCIPRRNVSREHAAIQATPAGFLLKDLGSQNGTLVNGDTIKECLLHDGDLLVIGDAQIEFRLLAPPGR